MDSPQAVVELMAKELSQYDREVFCILNMKNNGQVINMNLVSVGTINASLVIPREVFRSSILANASAIIGLHNHPSGNVKPSKEDMIVTRKLQKCGQLLGIELLDHIIVGGTNGKMLSFREDVYKRQVQSRGLVRRMENLVFSLNATVPKIGRASCRERV